MEKERQVKLLSIVALVLAISAMTLGFAAFSTTLTISSSATVTPNNDDFKIKIYGVTDIGVLQNPPVPFVFDDTVLSEQYGLCYSPTSNATCEEADINGQTISNIKASFTSNKQVISYIFVLKNEGKYDAYLDLTNMEKLDTGFRLNHYLGGTCSSGEDVSQELLQKACVTIEAKAMLLDKTTYKTKTITEDYYLLASGDTEILGVTLYYDDGALVDGPFTVTFPEFQLNFSTTK